MKESNDLRHSINIDNKKVNCLIKIRLNDECKNGHQDFSVTATFWQIGKIRNDRNMICGGCCHDDILKVKPELKQFIDLHLCDFNGVPMYAEANGFYHLTKGFERLKGKTQKEYFCDYYRVSPKQYDILITAKEEQYFTYLLYDLGIIDQWKKEATKGIKELEKLTETKFINDSKRNNLKYNKEQIKEIEKQVKKGYYTTEEQNKRIQKEKEGKRLKQLEELQNNFNSKRNETIQDFELDKIGINLFGTTSNVIYYKHTNKVVLNWSDGSYNRFYSEDEFKLFETEAKKIEILKGIDFEFKPIKH